ncbi:hypothetical protein GXW78_05105 [Roseomonas terrae]|jgi:hypothetical protein|uniref:Right handed beta helix domain-containing protein n=1 Tax=Neoroseomonas terrae TaxID=424799 RepID=A0ABS5EDC5_9PROT|nr:NosD domain-containing protein [Neoroseomonas terrae]MBR0649030.1 hypothetical protein [Neoroseomonas terrae]
MRSAVLAVGLWLLTGIEPGAARVLEVGPGRAFAQPSDAAAAAADGDIIRIAAGTYRNCAVWRSNRIVIEGENAATTIVTERSCQGKGIFIITGNDVTVRNLTLSGARVPDANGAGIRAEGAGLTVENLRFLGNENGILTGQERTAWLVVRDSEFIGNGSCERDCAHGIYAGNIGLLRVERSRFIGTRQGHHIKSRAWRTEILGNEIDDGPDGTASYLIDIPNGGAVVIRGNRMRKGPHSQNRSTAITIGAEGVNRPTPEILIEGNSFILEGGYATTFVTNRTGTAARLIRNRIPASVRPLNGDGRVTARP